MVILIALNKCIDLFLRMAGPIDSSSIDTFLDFDLDKLKYFSPLKPFQLNVFSFLWAQHFFHLMDLK